MGEKNYKKETKKKKASDKKIVASTMTAPTQEPIVIKKDKKNK